MINQKSLVRFEQAIVEKLRVDTSGIRDAFLRLDLKGNGRISAEEFRIGLQSFGLEVDSETTNALVEKYDVHNEGCFDYSEFAKFYEGSFTSYLTSSLSATNPGYIGHGRYSPAETIRLTQEERMSALLRQVRDKMHEHGYASARSRHFSELFVKFDQNRNGKLSYDEIRCGFEVLGVRMSAREVVGILSAISVDGKAPPDGQVDLYDFFNLLQRVAEPSAIQPINHEEHSRSRPLSAASSRPPSSPGAQSPLSSSKAAVPLLPLRSAQLHSADSPLVQSGTKPAADDVKLDAILVVKQVVKKLEEKRMALKQAFKVFDVNGDKTIAVEELAAGLASIGVPLSEEHCRTLIAMHDRHNTGRLMYCDFVNMISSTLADAHQEAMDSPRNQQQEGHDSNHEKSLVSQPQSIARVIGSEVLNNAARKEEICGTQKPIYGHIEAASENVNEGDLKAAEGPGAVSYIDVISYVSSKVYKKYHALKRAFSEFDQDGSKSIDKEEFKKAVAVLGMNISDSQTKAIFDVFDTNKSGSLKYHEFVRLVAASGNDSPH